MALLLGPATARATRDDDLVARMKDRINTLTALMAEKTDPAEKERLAHRLETLTQELAIVEKRQAIDAQERQLQTLVQAQPREQLRGVLQTVPADTAAVGSKLRDLAARRAQVTGELDDLRRQLGELPAAADDAATVKRAELEEAAFVKDEELRALALQQEAAEVEGDLIAQAQVWRDRLRAADATVHLSLRGLYEQGLVLQGESTSGRQLANRRANVQDNLHNAEAAVDLARQKQEKFDEELKLLESRAATAQSRAAAAPSGTATRRGGLERFIASENAHKEVSGQRLAFLTAQVEALRRTRTLLETQEKLNAYGHRFLEDQFRSLWIAYLRRLGGPVTVAVALVLLYLVISRLVLARRYRKEELFLARRLARYGTVLLVAVVGAVYLIEDITALATTLGLVSAALVISLQDVCASFFAWFIIMLGHKFTIGDRLEIDGTKGDVLDIQLLRTTLIEVNNWLGADQPTGRIIVIPNNLIFKTKVFNYSHGHPFIWNKVDVTVTYGTPVAGALALFTRVLEEETREEFAAARHAAAAMERRYGVADADYQPKIHTRLADSGVTFSLFYVSHYRHSSAVRNRLNRRLVAELENRREIQLAYNTVSVLTSPASDGPSAVLGTAAAPPPPVAPRA
ncbi:MAG TPA: mechanosensitive ion channel domain-containing protein [Opitutaceae bacterium]|nr:mechanosensitive ion channel domain-containing protein [Opitutaceae bacterium]